MRKTFKILLLAVMLLVMVGVTMLVASAEGGTFQVATVNGESTTAHGDYATLEEAIAALPQFPGANTIKLLADVDVATTLTINASVTLDGNGKTVKAAGLTIDGEGTVCTIKNVTMTLGKILTNAGTSVTVEGSSFTMSASSAAWTINGAFVIQNGCSFTTTTASCTLNASGSLTVHDGTFNIKGYMLMYGRINIQGGTWTIGNFRGFQLRQTFEVEEGEYHAVFGKNVKINAYQRWLEFEPSADKTKVLVEGGEYNGGIYVNSSKNVTLVIEGGTFDNRGIQLTGSSDKKNHFAVGVANATVVVNGGTFYGRDDAAFIALASGKDCSFTINDGTFTTTGIVATGVTICTMTYNSTLNINGGTFTTEDIMFKVTAGTVNITGGTFNSKSSMTLSGTATTIDGGEFHLAKGVDLGKGTVAINGGKFYDTDDSEAGQTYFRVAVATVTINGATLENDGVAIQATSGTITVKGGTFRSGSIVVNGAANLTVTDGEFHLATGMQVMLGTVVIEGGAFYGANGALISTILVVSEEEGVELEAPTVTINGGTFENEGNALEAEWGTVTLAGGTFRTNGISVGGETDLTVTAGKFYFAAGMQVAGVAVAINGGAFYGEGAGENHLFFVDAGAELTINGASLEVKGEGYDVFRANEDGVILVDAATITICGGATVATDLNGVEFAGDPDNGVRTISVVIAAGSTLPSESEEDIPGYAGQWWSVNWFVKLEQAITEDTTVSTLEDLSGAIEELLADYADITVEDNCQVSVSFTVANGATLTIDIDGEDIDVFGTLVTVENGSLVIANGKFIVAAGASIVSGGALTVENGLFIVTGQSEMLFDCTTIDIVKAIVVGEDCTIMEGTALNEYAAQVLYGGNTYRAWVKLAATDAEISASQVLGAEIEISAVVEVADGMGGIRFKSTISAAVAEKLLQKYPTATFAFGTVIAPAEYVAAAGAFTMEALGGLAVTGAKYVDIPATVTKVDADGNGIPEAFSGALISLNSTTRAYAAVSYIKVTTGEGTIVLYGEYDSAVNARSAKQIADAIIADQGSNYYTEFWSPAQKALVDVYAGKISE